MRRPLTEDGMVFLASAISNVHFVEAVDQQRSQLRRILGNSDTPTILTILPLVERPAETVTVPSGAVWKLPARWEATGEGGTDVQVPEVVEGLFRRGEATLAPGAYCAHRGELPTSGRTDRVYLVGQCSPFRVVEKQDQAWVAEFGGD